MKRQQWTDDIVKNAINEFVKATGKFPTNTALRECGRNDLACQIVKRGGYLFWSEKLGISRDASDSDTGWNGEIAVAEKLRNKGFTVHRQNEVRWPFDLLVNGVLRIDVKTANRARYGHCEGWFYRIGKAPQADMIALHQMDTKETYFIPWFHVPRSSVTISNDGGIYASYLERFDLVRGMVAVRAAEHIETKF